MPPATVSSQLESGVQVESDTRASFSTRIRKNDNLSAAGTEGVETSPPPVKRRRVTLACGNCRSRKSRCDGVRPRCSMCQDLGCECLYKEVGDSPNLTVGKEYLAHLNYRIEQIEEFIRPLRQASQVILPSKSLPSDTNLNPAVQQNGARNQSEGQGWQQASTTSNSEMGELDRSENAIDGMGAINFTDEEDSGFFGPSSNIAFMRHISHAISQAKSRTPYVPPLSTRDRYHTSMINISRSQPAAELGLKRSSSKQVNIYTLPPESRIWLLIQKYFSKTGQLLPFVHEESFCETYLEMKRTKFTRVRRTWLGLLNIVLAIATSLATDSDLPAEKRIEESDIYYQRANALCDSESKRNTSLEMVQYLLILGQYLQGTQKSVQAWNTHGLAITAAFQMGLHSPEANRGYSLLDREIRKRTWFGCILLDRTLSMTFGRPCIIPQSYVKLEMPNSDTRMLRHPSRAEFRRQNDGNFFTAAIQLYVIMYDVIDVCYGQNLGFEDPRSTLHLVTYVLEGDRKLDEWQHRLLPELGLSISQWPLLPSDIGEMASEDIIAERFNIVLSLRYHNLRILLHRRLLELFLKNFGTENICRSAGKVLQQVGVSSVQNCVESATIIIGTVHTIVSSSGWRKDLLGAWNYSLYYTFNAGLVIFGAILVSSKQRFQDPVLRKIVDNSRQYLEIATEALRCLDSGNRVIERCLDYLNQLLLATNSLDLPARVDTTTYPRNKTNMASASVGDSASAPPVFHPSMSSSQVDMNVHPSRSFNDDRNPDVNPQNQPPMAIDLGEFMIDSDLDFLSRLFDIANSDSQNVDC